MRRTDSAPIPYTVRAPTAAWAYGRAIEASRRRLPTHAACNRIPCRKPQGIRHLEDGQVGGCGLRRASVTPGTGMPGTDVVEEDFAGKSAI